MEIASKLNNFFKKCLRVWYVLKKPTREEFINVAKVSAIGILAIGMIGFLIALIVKVAIGR